MWTRWTTSVGHGKSGKHTVQIGEDIAWQTALLDTNILIDYLNGVAQAKEEIARYPRCAISVITWMEVLVGVQPAEEAAVTEWLTLFDVIDITPAIAQHAVQLRRRHRMRLPAAIIWASAQIHGCLLVSRNHRDFPAHAPDVRVPYQMP